MAERKYTGTDAELLRRKREGLSVRAIAAEVGIGKSVAGARIARAEAAERRRAEPRPSTQADREGLGEAAAAPPVPASDQPPPEASISATLSPSAGWAPNSSEPDAAGPINIRAELEAIARDPKTPSREKLGALKELARIDERGRGPDARQFVQVNVLEDGTLVPERPLDHGERGYVLRWIAVEEADDADARARP